MTTLLSFVNSPSRHAGIVSHNIPHRAVEGRYAPDIPRLLHPAPNGGVAVHPTPIRSLDKNIRQGHDERNPVAAQEIGDLHLA